MTRLPKLTPDAMTDTQRELYSAITGGARFKAKGGPLVDMVEPEGALRGPFNAWLHVPEAGHAAQQLGARLRFESSLSGAVREVAILAVAKAWRSQYEWWAHAQIARKEGVAESAIEAIRDGREIAGDPLLESVRRFVDEMMETKRVSDATYRPVHAALGDRGTAELVTLAGYYAMISANLNVFEVPLPEGHELPFQE